MSETIIKQVNVSEVRIKYNYREEYNVEFLQWLTDEIQAHGFNPAKPLDVYFEDGLYWIVDGNTRYTAAMRVALMRPDTLEPICPVWVAVRPVKPSDSEFALYSAQGNETSIAVDVISQAKNYRRILDGGMTITDICKQLNHTVTYVEDRLTILSLAEDIQDFVKKGNLTIKFAVAMAKLNFNRQRIALKAYNLSNLRLIDFETMVNRLYSEQMTEENQTSFFGLLSIEEIQAKAEELAATIQTTKAPKISDLEAQLDIERTARIAAEQKAQAESQERQRIYDAGDKLHKLYTALQSKLEVLALHTDALEIQLVHAETLLNCKPEPSVIIENGQLIPMTEDETRQLILANLDNLRKK